MWSDLSPVRNRRCWSGDHVQPLRWTAGSRQGSRSAASSAGAAGSDRARGAGPAGGRDRSADPGPAQAGPGTGGSGRSRESFRLAARAAPASPALLPGRGLRSGRRRPPSGSPAVGRARIGAPTAARRLPAPRHHRASRPPLLTGRDRTRRPPPPSGPRSPGHPTPRSAAPPGLRPAWNQGGWAGLRAVSAGRLGSGRWSRPAGRLLAARPATTGAGHAVQLSGSPSSVFFFPPSAWLRSPTHSGQSAGPCRRHDRRGPGQPAGPTWCLITVVVFAALLLWTMVGEALSRQNRPLGWPTTATHTND